MESQEVPRHVGVFGISVAASMAATGVQNLRAYEKRGLLAPERTSGGTRLYSRDDINRARRIALLLRQGLNLAGIGMVLELEERIVMLERQVTKEDRDF